MAQLAALRRRLHSLGVDAFLMSRTDPRGSEYLAPRYERLARLTGFTGSAGTLLVLPDRALLFVDGRYTLQAADETDPAQITLQPAGDRRLSARLREDVSAGTRVGYDPELFSVRAASALHETMPDVTWVPLPENPVDAVCPPPEESAPYREFDHLIAFAGRSSEEKCTQAAAALSPDEAFLFTDPGSISWLLNRRALGIPCLPAVEGYLLLHADGHSERLNDLHRLPDLTGRTVCIDETAASQAARDALIAAGARVRHADDPCTLPKACKNDAELAGIRDAHRRDGAALWRVLCAVDRGEVRSEMHAAALCRQYREETGALIDLSFDPICGHGPNGAVVHYRASARTDRELTPGTLLLIDSGGHYLDGTTDVTRTLALGTPTDDMRRHYTLVLRGHLALASVTWPADTELTGAHLDILARAPLWEAGLDYAHGTGHGVGMCLSVHEGPQSISLRSQTPLRPGMVLSNEPGFYLAGAYGIRIENLQALVAAPQGRAFETLTLVPYDRRLIVTDLLAPREIAQIDAYHARVCEALTPLLPPDDARALQQATRPLL